jgi:threonine synthase
MIYLLTAVGISVLEKKQNYTFLERTQILIYLLTAVGISVLEKKQNYPFLERTQKMIYLLTTVGLSPGGSTHLHTNTT